MSCLTLARKTEDAQLLEAIAREELARAGSPHAALVGFVAEVRDAGGLVCELLDDRAIEFYALLFLEQIENRGN